MEFLQHLSENHAILSAPWMWTIFGIIVLVLLYLDLFVFHRHAEEPKLSGNDSEIREFPDSEPEPIYHFTL